uniref:Uncharacterized protein n=1 Tax=Buteo japonicus TaxID=224669 RepID=A0A8C0B2E1_9AVES
GLGRGPHLVIQLLVELADLLLVLAACSVSGTASPGDTASVSPSSAGKGWMGSPPRRQGPPLPLRQRLSSASSFPMVSFSALFFSFSFSYFFFHCSAVSSRFTEAVFLIPLPYLCPNMRVDLVSASL